MTHVLRTMVAGLREFVRSLYISVSYRLVFGLLRGSKTLVFIGTKFIYTVDFIRFSRFFHVFTDLELMTYRKHLMTFKIGKKIFNILVIMIHR